MCAQPQVRLVNGQALLLQQQLAAEVLSLVKDSKSALIISVKIAFKSFKSCWTLRSTYLCALLLLASSTPFLYVIGCCALCFEMSNCSFISFQVCFGTHNKLDRMICVVSPLPPTLPLHLRRSTGEITEKKRKKMSVYVKPLLTSSVPRVDIECALFSFDFDAHLCSTVGEAPNIGGRYLRLEQESFKENLQKFRWKKEGFLYRLNH